VPHYAGGGAAETVEKGKFFEMIGRGRSAAEKKDVGRQIASTFYWGD